ncbi:MAG: hypothetical protein M9887_12300, partial [Chitinophagales bacterium]|nr:hypothetical protein [Chitinophagales bacterium]
MKKSILYFLLIISCYFYTNNPLLAQTPNVEIELSTDGAGGGMFTQTTNCSTCGGASTAPNATRYAYLKFGSNAISTSIGFDAAALTCGAYSTGGAGTQSVTQTSAYTSTSSIYLAGTDSRSPAHCRSNAVAQDKATDFNFHSIAPGGAYSSVQTSTLSSNTSTVGVKWKWRWRYTSVGPAGTLSTTMSYCNNSPHAQITITGTDPGYPGVTYQWFDGTTSINGATAKDLSNFNFGRGVGSYTFKREVYYPNSFTSTAKLTTSYSITIDVLDPPSGTVNSPVEACENSNVNITFRNTSGLTGADISVYKTSDNSLVHHQVYANPVSFDAPDIPTGTSYTEYYYITAVSSDGLCSGDLGNLTVNVRKPAVAPSSITSSVSATGDTVCQGSSVTLTANGGDLGYNGEYQWSDDADFTNILQQSTSTTYTTAAINSQTTYYVRIVQGTPCGETSYAEKTINISIPSVAPVSVASSPNNYYCDGDDAVVLTQQGGSLGTNAHWEWATDTAFANIIADSNRASLLVKPSATTTYYVRATGTQSPCTATTASANTTIQFRSLSTAATGILSSNGGAAVCEGSNVTLTVDGGSLGYGADWIWYTGSCGQDSIGSDSSIIVAPNTTTKYWVRAEGGCNVTSCKQIEIIVYEKTVDPDSIAMPLGYCDNVGSIEVSVVGGHLGTNMQWNWYDGNNFSNPPLVSGSPASIDPFNVTTNYLYLVAGPISGSIPAGCPSSTTPISVDVSTLVHDLEAPNINSISALPDVICETGSSVITVIYPDSVNNSYIWDNVTEDYDYVKSPLLVYNLYDEDPSVNPSAQPIASNGTGIFSIQNIDTTTTYYGQVVNTCGESSVEQVTVTVNYPSVDPDSLSANKNPICNGESATITVNGGHLGTDAQWVLYDTDPTVGSPSSLQNNTTGSFVVSPTDTTTYYVRFEGTAYPCTENGNAVQIRIDVNQPSVNPDSLTANIRTVCSDDNSVTLTVSGGHLGTNAEWVLYDTDPTVGSPSSLQNNTTGSFIVTPSDTTTYYVRFEGNAQPCDENGSAANITINVNQPSDEPTAITALDSICNGEPVTLTADGTLGTSAVYQWSDDAGFNNLISNG